MTKFYYYHQNNSGGFHTQLKGGYYHLLVEAENEIEADRIAEQNGVYFDGCEKGIDCDCCGDRWYRQHKNSAYNSFEDFDFTESYYQGALIIRK